MSLPITRATIDDALDEDDETFFINLGAPVNATLADNQGVFTIVDNDLTPTLSIDNGGCSVTEGHSVSVNCSFVARLSAISGRNVGFTTATANGGATAGSVQVVVERVGGSAGAASVQYASANGSAIAGLDYGAASGTLNWAAGDAIPKTVTLTIVFDPAAEPQESFTLNLSQASGATLGTPATSTITIVDGTQVLHQNGFE